MSKKGIGLVSCGDRGAREGSKDIVLVSSWWVERSRV